MRKHTSKRDGIGLAFKTFSGRSKKSYIVFRTPKGGYHAFVEVDAKEAAQDCGAPAGNTRAQWKAVWDAYRQVKQTEPVIPKVESKTGTSIGERLKARRAAAK